MGLAKLFGNKKTKIICAIAMTAFSACATGVGVYAWFETSTLKQNKSTELAVRDCHNVTVVENSYTVYYYDKNQEKGVSSKDGNLTLNAFDTLIGDNEYNKKYINLKLTYPNGIKEATKLEISFTCTGNLWEEENANPMFEAKNISNLIGFKFYDNTNGAIPNKGTTIDADAVYSACLSTFDDITNNTTFVELTDNSGVITANKEKIVIDTSISVPATSPKKYTTDLFIELNYDEDLIGFFKLHVDENFDLDIFKDNFSLDCSPDITELKFDLEGGVQ